MMGERRQGGKDASWRALAASAPADHILRRIDHHLDLAELRDALAPHYSQQGRPSIAPELLIRRAVIGRLYAITSERRLCDGLAATEAACQEALREGVHSADVVLNILARQREPTTPAITVITPDALRLRHEPEADFARYDSLRRAVWWNAGRSSPPWAS